MHQYINTGFFLETNGVGVYLASRFDAHDPRIVPAREEKRPWSICSVSP